MDRLHGVGKAMIRAFSFFLFLPFIPNLYPLSLTTVFAADGAASPGLKIAVVRLAKIFEEYEKTKSSESQLEGLNKSKQAERERLVSEIKGMRDELILLNEEARQERQKGVEEKLKSLAGFDRETKETLRKKRDDAMKGILDEIEQTVTGYAKENDFTLVLNEQAVLYGVESIDVTDQVLSLLNERYAKTKR